MQIKETVLLLGGTGFIGRNIIDYVLKNEEYSNYKIVVLSRDIQRDFNLSVEHVAGDYADKGVLRRLFSKWNFTKVFHCATSTTPLTSGNNILSDINGNLIATIGLLDVMRDFGCKFILYLSSGGAVYGEKNLEKISENDICEPLSSYGVIKLTIENYLRLYQRQYGISYLILRISNPFGRFHTSEKQGVVNIAIRRALRSEKMEIWGNGMQSKDYIYVDDLIRIIFLLLKKEIVNKTLNIGSGKSYQLNCILNTIRIYLPNLEVHYIESKTMDVKDFCLDISLVQSFVNLKFTEFQEAIQQTIFWENSRKSIPS
jgi:UDP-glucose 4-epimerase